MWNSELDARDFLDFSDQVPWAILDHQQLPFWTRRDGQADLAEYL
jgi:hypothetical protein